MQTNNDTLNHFSVSFIEQEQKHKNEVIENYTKK